MFSTILRSHGYPVLEAASGAEALEKLRVHEGEIRVLVTDIVMPHLNGIDLAVEIQRQAPRIKVLYISGYALANLASQGFAVDRIDTFLQKPFTPAVLASRVSELLDPGFP
jgi:two-component system cell cycle sensor histidine kinase/response regulator CckA